MNPNELNELMHAVLDGEATAGEEQELDRVLAGDPAARARFDELRLLFDGLAHVPKGFPSEGLVAAVMARVPEYATQGRVGQLFSPSRVIGLASKEARVTNPGRSATVHRVFQPGPFFRGTNMSEQQRSRKIWIGAGIAVAAAAVVAVFSDHRLPARRQGRQWHDRCGAAVSGARRFRPARSSSATPSGAQSGQTGSGAGGVATGQQVAGTTRQRCNVGSAHGSNAGSAAMRATPAMPGATPSNSGANAGNAEQHRANAGNAEQREPMQRQRRQRQPARQR